LIGLTNKDKFKMKQESKVDIWNPTQYTILNVDMAYSIILQWNLCITLQLQNFRLKPKSQA
jgi:hypothetical protein